MRTAASHGAGITDRLTGLATGRFTRLATGITAWCYKFGFQIHKESAKRTERTTAAITTGIAGTTQRFTRLASNYFARFAGNHFTWLARRCFARLTSNRFTRLASRWLTGVTAIPDYGKPSKNAGFGTRCRRKNDNRGQQGYYKFVFHC
jgi:hypothetical protein